MTKQLESSVEADCFFVEDAGVPVCVVMLSEHDATVVASVLGRGCDGLATPIYQCIADALRGERNIHASDYFRATFTPQGVLEVEPT